MEGMTKSEGNYPGGSVSGKALLTHKMTEDREGPLSVPQPLLSAYNSWNYVTPGSHLGVMKGQI